MKTPPQSTQAVPKAQPANAPSDSAAARAQRLFDELRAGSLDPKSDGVCRDTYGEGEAFAHRLVEQHANELGLVVEHDHFCNTFMRWPGTNPSLPAVLIGSHLDSVPAGGNFDGAAGVVAGLIAIDLLQRQGVKLERDVVVMGIRAEESIWFEHSYIGSRGALGVLNPEVLNNRRVDTGRTLAEHLSDAGGDVQAVANKQASLRREDIEAFFEVHIEQAPSLAADGHAIAVGTAIPGNVRYASVKIRGEYGHVGLPRRFRHDAALAGARIFTLLDDLWQQSDAQGKPMAFTIGKFFTDSSRHGLTIVPGEFGFSLDLRAYEPTFLSALEARFLEIVQQVQAQCGVTIDLGARASAPVALADTTLSEALRASARELSIDCPDLLSPASHDSAAFCSAGVPFGFVFIRNPKGSHHPQEDMALSDFMAATTVLAHTLSSSYSA
jgi:N-carbamoyl-L-amino-acid hydrolase